jgi:outer membrane beta-barrel protein
MVMATICANADDNKMELPADELAKESVTPIFDKNISTKNRNIVTEGKFDVNGFYGWALSEPIASVSKLGLTAYYHPSENHAWGLMFAKNFAGVSIYAQQLKERYSLDFSRVPAPEMTLMADYNLNGFYGKMSLSKKTVLNMHVLGSLAGGVVKYQHKTFPAVAIGAGQKFYFSKSWGFRFDLRLYIHNAPVPFLADKLKVASAPPEYSEFKERLHYISVLDVGVSYLF